MLLGTRGAGGTLCEGRRYSRDSRGDAPRGTRPVSGAGGQRGAAPVVGRRGGCSAGQPVGEKGRGKAPRASPGGASGGRRAGRALCSPRRPRPVGHGQRTRRGSHVWSASRGRGSLPRAGARRPSGHAFAWIHCPRPEGSVGRVPAPAQGAAPPPGHAPLPGTPRAPSWATSLSPGDVESRPHCPTDCAKVWGSQPRPRRRELPSAHVPRAPTRHVGVSEGPRLSSGNRAPRPLSLWFGSGAPGPCPRLGEEGRWGRPEPLLVPCCPGGRAGEGAGGAWSCSPERAGPGRGSAAPPAPPSPLDGTWPGGPHVGLRDPQGQSPSVPGTRGCVGRAGAGGPVNAVPPCERPQPPAVSPARRTGPAWGAPHPGPQPGQPLGLISRHHLLPLVTKN